MVWKKVVNSDAGDSDHFGGNDLDKVSDAFSGVDVDDFNMACDFVFQDGKFQTRNPAGTQTLTWSNPPVATAVSRTFPLVMSPYKYTIHKLGSHHYAMKYDGTILSVDTTGHPEIPIQAAIDACEADGGGDVFITGNGAAGAYILSGSWTGFTIGNNDGGASGGPNAPVKNVRVICGQDCYIKVNAALGSINGAFCKFTNATFRCGWYGGYIYVSGVPAYDWTGFLFDSNSQAGSAGHTVADVTLLYPGKGICFTNTGADGYVNGCEFKNIWIHVPETGVLFDQSGTPYTSGNNSFNRNNFNNVVIEMSNAAGGLSGFKDIIGRDNSFMHCKVWDQVGTASYHSTTITANAENTIILGGIMRAVNYTNLSPTTWAYDMWGDATVNSGVPYTTENYVDTKTMSAPSSPATNYTRAYAKQIDSNNDGLFVKRKLNGSVVEVQVG